MKYRTSQWIFKMPWAICLGGFLSGGAVDLYSIQFYTPRRWGGGLSYCGKIEWVFNRRRNPGSVASQSSAE